LGTESIDTVLKKEPLIKASVVCIFLDRLSLANLVEGHGVMKNLYIFVLILQRNVPYANVLLDASPPFCKTILTNHFCYLFSLLPGQSKWLEVLQKILI
jgi:hypothetical protein